MSVGAAASPWESHQHPNLSGHRHAAGAEQPRVVGSALGWCLSSWEGSGCPLRPQRPPWEPPPPAPPGRRCRGVCLFNEAGLGAAPRLAQGEGWSEGGEGAGARGSLQQGEAGTDRSPPPGTAAPQPEGQGIPPGTESSAEGRDPAGAEPSLQPLCHPPPPPPGKGRVGGVWGPGPRGYPGLPGGPRVAARHGGGQGGVDEAARPQKCRNHPPAGRTAGNVPPCIGHWSWARATGVWWPQEQWDPFVGQPCQDMPVLGGPGGGWDIFWEGMPVLGHIEGK